MGVLQPHIQPHADCGNGVPSSDKEKCLVCENNYCVNVDDVRMFE